VVKSVVGEETASSVFVWLLIHSVSHSQAPISWWNPSWAKSAFFLLYSQYCLDAATVVFFSFTSIDSFSHRVTCWSFDRYRFRGEIRRGRRVLFFVIYSQYYLDASTVFFFFHKHRFLFLIHRHRFRGEIRRGRRVPLGGGGLYSQYYLDASTLLFSFTSIDSFSHSQAPISWWDPSWAKRLRGRMAAADSRIRSTSPHTRQRRWEK